MAASYPSNWERNLLSLASQSASSPSFLSNAATEHDSSLLARAYACCERITAEQSKSFYLTSRLLPPQKRRAIHALYAFCRVTDNIVDCPDGDCAARLALWRRRALSSGPAPNDPVAMAWSDTRLRYHIPTRYAEQLIEGVALDLERKQYRTFQDLTVYAYSVASTVGLMSMHIIGYAGDEAIPYAIKLGVALQLTNILRDVGQDWRDGRLYLPLQELAAFGLSPDDISAAHADERWREFMRFQIARNRQLYAEAMPGIRLLDRDGRFAVRAAAELYRAILGDIEAHACDVFHRRAYLGKWSKLSRLPGIWLRSQLQ